MRYPPLVLLVPFLMDQLPLPLLDLTIVLHLQLFVPALFFQNSRNQMVRVRIQRFVGKDLEQPDCRLGNWGGRLVVDGRKGPDRSVVGHGLTHIQSFIIVVFLHEFVNSASPLPELVLCFLLASLKESLEYLINYILS